MIELATAELQGTLIEIYNEACPILERGSLKNPKWWTKELQLTRGKLRKAYNYAIKHSKWNLYKKRLLEYNRELRRSKRAAWKTHCEEIMNIKASSRLCKVLKTDQQCQIQTLKREDGSYTADCLETVRELVKTHFPGSFETGEETNLTVTAGAHAYRATSADWSMANKIVTQDRVIWAVRTFDPF